MAKTETPQSPNDQSGSLSTAPPVSARRLWRFQLAEDEGAVLIGGVLIAAVLAIVYFANGYKFQVPVYQWASFPFGRSHDRRPGQSHRHRRAAADEAE